MNKPSEILEYLDQISNEEIVVRNRSSIYMNPNDNNKGAFTHLTTVGVNFKGIGDVRQAVQRLDLLENACDVSTDCFSTFKNQSGNKVTVMRKETYDKYCKYKEGMKILREKRVDLSYLRTCFEDNQSVYRYNEYIRNKTMDYDGEKELTEEEFELLREMC